MRTFKHRENPWGNAGAGVLFTCEEDNTMLLFLRSRNVEEPNTWGIVGGSISGEYFTTLPIPEHQQLPINSPRFAEGALEEIEEECGTLPPNISVERLNKSFIDFVNQGFRYRDFIYDMTLAEKREFTENIELNWENDSFQWFTLDQLESLDLHFGMEFILENI